MSEARTLRRAAPAFPATITEFDSLWRLKKPIRNLNDIVEEINRALIDNPEYQKYLAAIWPEETIEGRADFDDARAAMMIQAYAEEHGIDIPRSSNKLSPIVKSLHVVLSRRGLTRKQRRLQVSGVTTQEFQGHSDSFAGETGDE